MPKATGSFNKDPDNLWRLRLEVHWKELRRVLPNLLCYHQDLEQCIETSDVNELRVFQELMGVNSGSAATPEEREQAFGLADLIIERLHLSRKEQKYRVFCKILEDKKFTHALALLRKEKTPQERRLFDYLAEYYRSCLVSGDGKAAAASSDKLVDDNLLTTLKDFGVLTSADAEAIYEAGEKNWPVRFIMAIVFSEGNCACLEQLLPGFVEFLSKSCSLEQLRERLGEAQGPEFLEAEALVREAFDTFLQSNSCAFEDLQAAAGDASAAGAAAAAAAFDDDEEEVEENASSNPKAESPAADVPVDKRRLLVTMGDDPTGEAAEAEAEAGQQMRAYQLELAEAGLLGRNTVIVAPTGSGKTLVGIKIAAQRLRESPDAKVAFLADRTQLVDQQYAAFKQSLPPPYCDRVVCIRGGAAEPFPLSYCLKEHSVLVVSTQILLNNLTDQSDDGLFGDLSRFRLLIFDECHHCDKEHPSKKIMDLYFKFRDAHPTRQLPQIVGLTASPGTEKARNQQQAVDHVLKICANLDCEILCTVRHNKDSLKSSVPSPSDQMHWAPAKPLADDFVLTLIDSLMLEAEERMATTLRSLGFPEMSLPRPPAARGSFMYTNYCGKLHQQVKEETRDDPARALYAAWRHLSKFNFAHLICSLFRSVDAVKYLQAELVSDREPTCPLDAALDDSLQKALNAMDAFCQGNPLPAGSSPALDILADILSDQFAQNADSRVIVFVQQRCFTLAVKDFLDKTQAALAAKGARAAIMTGANACGASGGITQNAQTDTLADFRRGTIKILISTSVSEEGLDVQKCNTVVRFCHVTNEIAMVQSKGRGRAEGSTYHVIVPQQLDWLARKEKTNKMRDELMQRAVLKISEMPALQFNAKMKELQDEISCMREIREVRLAAGAAGAAGAPSRSVLAQTDGHYKLLCKSCNTVTCTSLDLRLMAEKHYVVLHDELLTQGRACLRPKEGGSADDLLSSQLICAECQAVWGGLRKFKEVVFPWLKVESFKFVKSSTGIAAFGIKKWTDTGKYFQTAELSNKEILKKAEALSEARYMELLSNSEVGS